MKKLTEKLEKFMPHTLYVVLLPAFFLAFCLLYDPFGIIEYLSFGVMSYSFHLMMLSCIIFLTVIITRAIYYRWSETINMPLWKYILWCIGEAFIVSCFAALYTVLFKADETQYFSELSTQMKFIFLSLLYPYIFLIMYQLIKNSSVETKTENTSLAKFYDEHKRLKLSIAPQAILFVKAENSYIRINYLDAGKPKEFVLRNSMKSVEESGQEVGLVRCQRSWFVNPSHVTVLRKDHDGFIFAELDTPGVPSVPVSKQYYDSISSLL